MDNKRKTYQRKYRENYKSKIKRVNLTLSNLEYKNFIKSAKKENTKVTSLIKELALTGLRNNTQIPSDIKEELKILRFAIHNIANNVNQIAHHSNTIKNMTQSDENNLLQHLKQLDETIRDYTSGQILSKNKKHDN